MSRAPRRERDVETPESDVFSGVPHPRHATRLIGHAAAEAELLNAFRGGRLAHAWLIGGREGIGKATLAWRFARFALCNPDPNAAAVSAARDLSTPDHPAARQLAALSNPDFALMRRAWNDKTNNGFYTEIRIDDVREQMSVFRLAAASGGYRVAIVDSADDLNVSSANALLKIIEEPPPKSLILILAHRLGAVMPTIRSRCRRLLLDPLTPAEIATIVKGLGAFGEDGEAVTRVAEASHGSVREALRRLDPASRSLDAMIEAATARLPRGDLKLNLRLAEMASARGAEAAYDRISMALYDWLEAEAKKPASPGRLETLAELWDVLRAAFREAEALNLDKRATLLAAFEEIAQRRL